MTLRLHNLVSPQLVLLAKEFEKLEGLILSLNASLGKISVDATGLRAISTATNATNRAFERATVAATAYESRLAAIHRLGGAIGAVGVAGGRAQQLPPGGGGGGGGGGRRGGGLHGGNIHLGPGGVGLGTVGMAAGNWFWPLAVTGAAIYGGMSLFSSAKDLDTERQRFKLFGMSDAQNSEAFRYAAGMRVYGTSQTENLRNFREAQGVFREAGLADSAALSGAKLAAPVLSKLNALDAALDDESAARSHTSNLAMLRYVESTGGLKSQAEFNRLANIGYKLKVGSGDTIDWQQLQQFQKRGGSSSIGISGEGMARLEPSISTLGGSTAGTALATAFGRLQGIVKNLPVPVIDELLQFGVWDKSKVQVNSHGGIAKFLDPKGPLSAANSKLLAENPEAFYEQVIRPIYAKMNLDASGVIRQNALIYGRTGGALANEWEKQLVTIQHAVSAFKKTMDIDAATAKLPDSLTGQQKEFEAAWTDFKTQFGTVMLPFFTGLLRAGSTILRFFSGTSAPDHAGQHLVYRVQGKDRIPEWVSDAAQVSHAGEHLVNRPSGKGFISEWVKDSPTNGTGSRFIAPSANSKPLNVNTTVTMDGRKVGQATTKHLVDMMGRPQTGIADFDGRQVMTPSGSSF